SAGNKEDQREAQGQGGQGGGGPSRPSRQRFLIRFQEPAVQPQGPGGRGTGQFGGGGRLQRGPGQDACGGRRFRRAGRGGSTPLGKAGPARRRQRHHRQRHGHRDQERRGHGDPSVAKENPRQAVDEQDGEEDHHGGEGGGDDRA